MQKSGILFEYFNKVRIFENIKPQLSIMKRLIITAVITAFIIGNIQGQDASTAILLNYSTLEKKVDKSNQEIEHEKKGLKEKTWIKRGKLFQDVENQGIEQAQLGMDKMSLRLFYKEPLSVETRENNVEVLKYETINYFFEEGRLVGWTRNKPLHPKPLDEALRSYVKAVELTEDDKKLSTEQKIEDELNELKIQFQREGQNDYYHRNLNAAMHDFESVLDINNQFSIFDGIIDTLMINYSGIIAREIALKHLKEGDEEKAEEMFRKAIDFYDELSDLGYNGASNYVQMTGDYLAIGDTLGAIQNLKKGLKQYPDSTILVTIISQSYYLMKDNEAGLEFIEKRLEQRPKCATAYYWKGLLLTNNAENSTEVVNEALALYDTSLMYDPTNANVMYQAGYVNYALGANYFDQESYEPDSKIRAELNALGKKYYTASSEKLEKTLKITDDKAIMAEALDLLKRIYYKLYGSEDEHYIRVSRQLHEL
jgi:tetratricopeptide (TPR) repeat protein